MNRTKFSVILMALLLSAGSCAKKLSVAPGLTQIDQIAATAPMARGGAGPSRNKPMGLLYADQAPRYVAESHDLEIITPESQLQKSWQSAIDFCGSIACEVISSKITTRTQDSFPSGTIALRVGPPDLAKLLAHVEKLGTLAQHTTEREDKTAAVVDTDAKLKNLTAFRDNLRAMLAKPSATVKDLIEIQQQLTETQSDLDSESAQRKVLANETEKIAVALTFRVERLSHGRSAWTQVGDALRESGSVMAESVASLITLIVAVIPWLVLIVPACWLLARMWRKLRRNRAAAAQTRPTS